MFLFHFVTKCFEHLTPFPIPLVGANAVGANAAIFTDTWKRRALKDEVVMATL